MADLSISGRVRALDVMRYLFQDMESLALVLTGVSSHIVAPALNLTRALCTDAKRHQWTSHELTEHRGRILEEYARRVDHEPGHQS